MTVSPPRLGDYLQHVICRFRAAGIDHPAGDARKLFTGLLGIEQTELIAAENRLLEPAQAAHIDAAVAARLSGKPVHRILGWREFFGRRFLIGKEALEPRPETELLVEMVLADHHDRGEQVTFAEIGIGSGAVAVSLLAELPRARALATDIDGAVLAVARKNARRHDVLARLELCETDCLQGVSGRFDFIVSNPPYIATGDIVGLSAEVRCHDPLRALDGGPDGLAVYRKILASAADRLMPGGLLYFETGHGQHAALGELAGMLGWQTVRAERDLSGLERLVTLRPHRSLRER